MKPSRKHLLTQRRVVGQKLQPWLALRHETRPPSGWLKAIRGALGLPTRQLAQLLGIDQANVPRLEERERAGTISLEALDRVAKAMHCKVIYAIVPEDRYQNLESIIDERAHSTAETIVQRTEHSMRLEAQGANDDELAPAIDRLAADLKARADPQIWGQGLPSGARRNRG
jgi:predicted DNA-binding mobile mystery protein A